MGSPSTTSPNLFDLADSLHRRSIDTTLFLRAVRLPDGTRTFRMQPGAPRPTSHGENSYRRILGDQPEAVDAQAGVASPG